MCPAGGVGWPPVASNPVLFNVFLFSMNRIGCKREKELDTLSREIMLLMRKLHPSCYSCSVALSCTGYSSGKDKGCFKGETQLYTYSSEMPLEC
jgi:hypothetical protein